MGYTTEFEGRIEIDKELDQETFDLLKGLSETRRMKRNIEEFGIEGEFYTKDDNEGVVEFNIPPSTQPSLWLDWTPTEDRKGIIWNGSEKSYCMTEWMEYIIDSILKPRGYILNGKILAQGEEINDRWKLEVKNNKVKVKKLK